MRINPVLARSVVFVGLETERGFLPTGTGWLICTTDVESHQFVFVVTASHIVEGVAPQMRDKFVARVNRKDGTAGYIPLKPRRQHSHENPANDITLFSVEGDWSAYECIAWELSRANIEKTLEEDEGVWPGDHVCAIGLYTSHHGEISNKPVVRTGNVAAVADEPLFTKRGYVEAHLIELRTIAGLSGSPVFQTFLPVRVKDGVLQHSKFEQSSGIPLGILVGYHVLESNEDQIVAPRQGQEPLDAPAELPLDQRNTGFGVVIPIERVLEVLEKLQPEMVAFVMKKKALATVVFAANPSNGTSA